MIDVVVKSRRLETQDIVVLELADPAGQALPDFAAGAHIDLVLGERLMRQYSLSRMPVANGCYEIGVLSGPQSRGGSVALHADRVVVHFDDGPAEQKLDALAVFRAAPEDARAYVCGPGGFMDYVLGAGAQAGWPESLLHREYFKAPDDGKARIDASFEIRIASSGAIIEVGETESIATALQRHRVSIEVSCEAGVCGACLTRVAAGIPDHRDYYLDDKEKAKNDQIMLCCSRAHSPSLTLEI
jgi:ferredoxin-NADP reductase